MRYRFSLIAVFFSIGALAGCGGGGGTVGTPATNVSPAPTPLNLTFSGSKEIIANYGYPASNPYPPEDLKSTLSQQTAAYGNISGYTGVFVTTQTETLPNAVHTTSIESTTSSKPDATSPSLTDLILGSASIKDEAGDTQVLTYPQPIVIDQQPEAPNENWTNGAALTSKETFADGSTDNRTQNADGSYTDQLFSSDGTDVTMSVNSDGSATMVTPTTPPSSSPNPAPTTPPGIAGGCLSGYSFGAPTGAPGTGTFSIVLTYNTPVACPTPSGTVVTSPVTATYTETAAAWFAPISTSNPLYSDGTAITAATTYPAQCNMSASAVPANKIERTIDSIDPLLGYLESTITDTYTVSGGGATCVIMNDALLSFYDWQGSNTGGSHNFLSGVPIQITQTTQTLTLQGSGGAPIGAQSAARLAPASIAAAEARFGARVDAVRTRKAQSVLRAMHNGDPIGVVSHSGIVKPMTFAAIHAMIHGGRTK